MLARSLLRDDQTGRFCCRDDPRDDLRDDPRPVQLKCGTKTSCL